MYLQEEKDQRSASPCPVSSEIVSEIENVKEQVAKIFKISSKRQIPMGLLNATEESFSCTICKICLPNPPLIGCCSCSSIVGCQSCVNHWYGSGQVAITKACHSEARERGFANTFEVKSLSSFLQELGKFVSDETEHSKVTKLRRLSKFIYIYIYIYRKFWKDFFLQLFE